MTDNKERKILHYAVVRPRGYYYPKAIVAVDAVSEKMITGSYAHQRLERGEGEMAVRDPRARWTSTSPTRYRYRVPRALVLATYPTLEAAREAFDLGDAVPSTSAFIDREQLNALDEALAAAHQQVIEATARHEQLTTERARLLREAAQAQGAAVRRAMGLPDPNPEGVGDQPTITEDHHAEA